MTGGDSANPDEVFSLTAFLHAIGREEWESPLQRRRVLNVIRALNEVARANHKKRYDAERKRRRVSSGTRDADDPAESTSQ